MDFGQFEEFWRWLSLTRLNTHDEMSVENILARVLGVWRSCVVCNLLRERAFELASRWQYVLAEDPEGQAQFLESQTWCNRHAWFFKELASPQTRGRLHRGLHARLERRMGELLKGNLAHMVGQSASHILRDLVGERTCPLCDDETAFRRALLEELARGLTSGSLRLAFAASAGCCLPHLGALLPAVRDEDTARFLLETTLDQIKRLTNELDTYEMETMNHRRRYGSAADAPARALVCWTGMRGMDQDPKYEERLSTFHGRMI